MTGSAKCGNDRIWATVPGTPGADDNASAVAVCVECARLIRRHDINSVMVVFFNREADGLVGSREFVAHLAERSVCRVGEAHIPAIMWTDTSEFRNPHYHRTTDTPDTLDFAFISDVTKLALARTASMAPRI